MENKPDHHGLVKKIRKFFAIFLIVGASVLLAGVLGSTSWVLALLGGCVGYMLHIFFELSYGWVLALALVGWLLGAVIVISNEKP